MRRLRIFAASTADTAVERAKVETVAAALKPLADKLGIVLDVVDWRSAVPGMGRAEQVILDQLKPNEWDVLVGLLWHRFGTPAGGEDPETGEGYASGTEEEFKTAYRLWQNHGRPRVMMYRCTRPIPPEDLDPDQFKRVQDFFKQFDAVSGKHPGLYHKFDTPDAFERLLLDHLQRLLLEYGEQAAGKPVEPEVVQELAPKSPDNLPRRGSFFGRDEEMGKVMRALSPEDRTWGVLLDGIGGIGKTALAVEAAHRCKDRGQFTAYVFVSAKQTFLKPGGIREQAPAARTLDEFLNETARALGQTGIPKLTSDDKRRALIAALRETPALLVYDNLETLHKEEQEALADFLRELPQGSKAIITSRRRGGEGAVWLRLEKLDWDAARQIIAEEAEKDALLGDKLRRAGESRWQELYDATGGSPLALSHTLGLMRVRASLNFDAALEMLRGNRDADLQNFIFQQARAELTTNDEAALRALSFFAPSATFEAWTEVSRLSRTALETTIDRLSALSLVDVLAGEDRYALHPLTRNFVRGELMVDEKIERETGMRFAGYWVAYAHRFGFLSMNYQTFPLIASEWANLDAAAGWLWSRAEVQGEKVRARDAAQILNGLARNLCGAEGPLFYLGWWEESLKLLMRAYAAARALRAWEDVGWRAYQAAWIYYCRDMPDEAENWANNCAEGWAHVANKHLQAMEAWIRGRVAQLRKDYDLSEKLFQEALAYWRESISDENVAIILLDLGKLELERENYDAAEHHLHESLAIMEKLASEARIAVTYMRLGAVALMRERRSEARNWYQQALSLSFKTGRQDLIANVQYSLALMYEQEGQPESALELAQQALAIYEKLSHLSLIRRSRGLVGRLKKVCEQLPPAAS